MTEISYKTLREHLQECGSSGFAPVFLIHGEEVLVKTAFESLLNAMLPDAKKSLNFEAVDGNSENIRDTLERVNTYALLRSTKVVAVSDSRVFYSKQDESKLLEKVREAHDKKDIKKAARHLVSLMGLLGLAFEDVRSNPKNKISVQSAERWGDAVWLENVLDFCTDNALKITAGEDHAAMLQQAIEKGFPAGNHLVIATDMVDKRRSLFKTIKSKGVVIDCAVPLGDRQADKITQEAVLKERVREILARSGKSLDKDAYLAIYENTGFDLRNFSSNLEKLVAYIGKRPNITVQDVESLLNRTRQDPIYELTNAIADRSVERCLFFLDSLLCAGMHPLQILTAMTNQIRKLLMAKDFVESPHGSQWQTGARYDFFKNRISPAIQNYDRTLLEHLEGWEGLLSLASDDMTERAKKKSSKIRTDLMILKNPQNPYPVYQLLLKSDRFAKSELLSAVEHLHQADLKLKRSGQRPQLILEEFILKLCGSGQKTEAAAS